MAKLGRRTPLIVASFLGGFLGAVLIASVWIGGERASEVFSEPMARMQTAARLQSLNAYDDYKATNMGGALGMTFAKEMMARQAESSGAFHHHASTGVGSSPAAELSFLESKKKAVQDGYAARQEKNDRFNKDSLQEYEQFIHLSPKNRQKAQKISEKTGTISGLKGKGISGLKGQGIAGLKGKGARTIKLNALDDWENKEAGGRFGSGYGSQVRRHQSAQGYTYGRETQVQQVSEAFAGFPAAHHASLGRASETSNQALLGDYDKFMNPKAKAARLTGLRQLPAKGVLQGQPWTYALGAKAQAAQDPYNHKALLKADPAHPGKVMLTQDALHRRSAYKKWERAHPTAAAEAWAASGSGIMHLDASRNLKASATHDLGGFALQNAGVKV